MLKDLFEEKRCFKLVCGAGNEDAVTLHLHQQPREAALVDLNGDPMDGDVTIQGETILLTAKPCSIGELRIRF